MHTYLHRGKREGRERERAAHLVEVLLPERVLLFDDELVESVHGASLVHLLR